MYRELSCVEGIHVSNWSIGVGGAIFLQQAETNAAVEQTLESIRIRIEFGRECRNIGGISRQTIEYAHRQSNEHYL